jgi:hypothetical protein
MKRLIIFLFILKLSLTFSQSFNDKIITLTGDTIKCQITSITDKCIFYILKKDKGTDNEYIFFSKVKDYALDKDSKPKIELKYSQDNSTIPANMDSLTALEKILDSKEKITEKILDSIASIPFKFNNSYAINVEALIVRDIKLTYTHWLFNRSYIETMLSYNFPFDKGGRGENRDPFNYYGRMQLRLGLKNYYKSKSYISPMLLFGYGYFNNGWVSEIGFGHADPPRPSWLITRNEIESEILLKFGWTLHHKHIMHDIYYGLGYRYKIMKDDIHEVSGGETNINYYPVGAAAKRTLYSGMIELHLGYQIGYCK